jgi:hypothetical protein
MSMSQQEFVLLPARGDGTSKPLSITPKEWQAALALCRRHGYYPPDFAGMSRDMVRWFRRSLSAALDTIAEPSAREPFERLVRFCEADGAAGFTLERRWKRCI